MATFLRGYKVNYDKLKKRYEVDEKDGLKVVSALIEQIPRDQYLEIELGVDKGCHGGEDGHYHMIVVLAKGNNEEELKKLKEETVCTAIEQAVMRELLTLGEWLNHSRSNMDYTG